MPATSSSFSRKAVMGLVVAGLLGSTAIAGSTGLLSPAPAVAQSALVAAPVQGFANLVDQVMPSVVSVRTKFTPAAMEGDARPRSRRFQFGFPPGSGLERFFENMPRGAQPQFRGPRSRRGGSQGSGFVVSEDGYLVTNNHVIKGASEVSVAFKDGREFSARVIGSDPKTDLALLKIESDETFKPLKFAEAKPRVGDWVIAVGNPFGLGGTVTTGIVSASGRDIGAGPYDNFLQIDAPINRGNSGGPAFNLKGEVIGVNTAIFSPSGGSVGIGFAIPASTAKTIVADLRDDGNVTRGWLGVQIQPVSAEIADSIGLDEAKGTIVAAVTEGSPAGKSGLRTGDTILGVDGEDIKGPKELSRKIAGIKPGTSVKMNVFRNGSERTISVKIGTMPGERMASRGDDQDYEPRAKNASALGLMLVPSEDGEGVAVAEVEPGSPAARRGLRAGDVILQVGGASVDEPDAARRAIRQSLKGGEKAVLLLVRNDRGQRFVALQKRKG